MARLFITPREIDFVNDIGKEVAKDIIGQKIYYYPISVEKTNAHDVFDESIEKVFENPIEIECFVAWTAPENTYNSFGHDKRIKEIKVYIQSRDLIQKEIEVVEGDFFTYGVDLFEVNLVTPTKKMYGQVEYDVGIQLDGHQVRREQFAAKVLGPTSEKYTDEDAVQDVFVQKRGFAENRLGETKDKRDLIENGVISRDEQEPAEVSSRGTTGKVGNAFFGDGD